MRSTKSLSLSLSLFVSPYIYCLGCVGVARDLVRAAVAAPADASLRVPLREPEHLAKHLPVPPDLCNGRPETQRLAALLGSVAVGLAERRSVMPSHRPNPCGSLAQRPAEDTQDVEPGVLRDLFATESSERQPKRLELPGLTGEVHGEALSTLTPVPVAGDSVPPDP